MLPLAALSPIALLIVALLLLRKPLSIVAPAIYVWTAAIATLLWGLPSTYLAAATLKGALIALEILIIVLGAIWFVTLLRETGVIRNIELLLARISPDRRIQAILIAWLFGSFIEGSAGFGTPAAIVAPLMIAIGFPPLLTVVLALVANSAAVTFGAVGTPVSIGMAGLQTEGVATLAAAMNLFAGLCVPLILLALVVRSRKESRLQSFLECLPWTLWAGLAFTLPCAIIAHFSDELPSLLGAAIGLTAVTLSLKYRFLVPKMCWRFEADDRSDTQMHSEQPRSSAITPYLVMVALLILSRFLLGGVQLELALPGTVHHSLRAFNPGFAFIATLLLLACMNAPSRKALAPSLRTALKALSGPFLSIFFITALVQTMLLSSKGSTLSTGMLETIVLTLQSEHHVWFSATLGAFGSFLAGSATVSNLLFAPLQQGIAQELGLSVTAILALQLLGSAIGNMIALPNILAVQATAGMKDAEGAILLRTIGPCLLYLLCVTLTGYMLLR